MIDGGELLRRIEDLKTVAKIPSIVVFGKYTMVVPYVELRELIIKLEKDAEKGKKHDTRTGSNGNPYAVRQRRMHDSR